MARRSDKPVARKPVRIPRGGQAGQASRADRSHREAAGDRSEPRTRQHPDDKLVRVAGLPSVDELFESGAERVERLYFEAALKAQVQPWCAYLARRHKVFRQIGGEEMQRVAGTVMHGGIVALARPRPIRDLDLSGVEAWAKQGEPLLILCGGGNPQNIGAIARTAAFYGVRRLVLAGHPAQSALPDAAYRVAKGGLEWLDVYRVEELVPVLRRLAAYYDVVGVTGESAVPLGGIERTEKPIALVLDGDEDGIPRAVAAACSTVTSLQGSGRMRSLNVSAAAAIIIHELLGPGATGWQVGAKQAGR